MFKVGDKVRAINTNAVASYVIDEICTVKSRESATQMTLIRPNGQKYSGAVDANWTLVEESMSELEQLVKKANEGNEARVILFNKYDNEIEIDKEVYRGEPAALNKALISIDNLRIKPKPFFKPFTVGSSWLVKLEGRNVSVGCKNFTDSVLMTALDDMCKNSKCEQTVHGYKLSAKRTGIILDGQFEISWADAERIVAALEKAGVK